MKPKSRAYNPQSRSIITRPELLTHPNIPKPLHGLAPREVKGRTWWDKVRKEAYAEKGHHCWACGKHAKTEEKWNKPFLEAHENYFINYEEGYMEITEITALCHLCHAFIHSGRLSALFDTDQMPIPKAEYILKRGFKLLKDNNLTPFFGTARVYANLFDPSTSPRAEELTEQQSKSNIQQDWTKWHLRLEGEKYYSKFKNLKEWSKHYGR